MLGPWLSLIQSCTPGVGWHYLCIAQPHLPMPGTAPLERSECKRGCPLKSTWVFPAHAASTYYALLPPWYPPHAFTLIWHSKLHRTVYVIQDIKLQNLMPKTVTVNGHTIWYYPGWHNKQAPLYKCLIQRHPLRNNEVYKALKCILQKSTAHWVDTQNNCPKSSKIFNHKFAGNKFICEREHNTGIISSFIFLLTRLEFPLRTNRLCSLMNCLSKQPQ